MQWLQRRSVGCGMVFGLVLAALSIDVTGQAGKRPLTYDVYDAWKTIQGTTVSRDGQWLAYAVTAQGVDGELIVRNLQSGQEYRHPRGTAPEITPDGKFVVFTIAQTKADEERQREQERRAGARGQGRGGEAQGEAARAPVRTSAGIMTLATGQVATVERVGSVRLPEESSTWVALYRGTGGGGRAGRGGRGAGRAGGPPTPPPATPAATLPAPRRLDPRPPLLRRRAGAASRQHPPSRNRARARRARAAAARSRAATCSSATS